MQVAVTVVGLGKLGACMAAAMASRGVRTVGLLQN
jgi:UDP-N-acetyl-D-mannosaminuronate dehydrogenase